MMKNSKNDKKSGKMIQNGKNEENHEKCQKWGKSKKMIKNLEKSRKMMQNGKNEENMKNAKNYEKSWKWGKYEKMMKNDAKCKKWTIVTFECRMHRMQKLFSEVRSVCNAIHEVCDDQQQPSNCHNQWN